MDFDKPKVYGDTFISDGLVSERQAATTTRSEKIPSLSLMDPFLLPTAAAALISTKYFVSEFD